MQVRIENKNENGEETFVDLVIEEQRLKDIIRVLSTAHF